MTTDQRKRARRKVPPVVRQLIQYINETPPLLSLLYDMDFMPEQLEPESRDWFRMLMLAEAWKANMPNARREFPAASAGKLDGVVGSLESET